MVMVEPSGASHSRMGGSTRPSTTVAVQVRVSMAPAVVTGGRGRAAMGAGRAGGRLEEREGCSQY